MLNNKLPFKRSSNSKKAIKLAFIFDGKHCAGNGSNKHPYFIILVLYINCLRFLGFLRLLTIYVIFGLITVVC